MRKPHQHEQDGQRFECSNPECRMPFKVQGPALTLKPVRRVKESVDDRLWRQAKRDYDRA